MSSPKGKAILQGITGHVVLGWFTREFPRLVNQIISSFQHRNEVVSGGVVTAGTVTASALGLSVTAVGLILNGRIKAALGALANVDLFTTAGNVAQPIYTNGATAAAISLATDEIAHVAIIACNSGQDGTAVDTDNGAPLYLAVVNGTASTFAAQTGPPTSVQIQAALEASTSKHAGVTGWVWLASVVWDENSASPTGVVTLNRNNVVQAL